MAERKEKDVVPSQRRNGVEGFFSLQFTAIERGDPTGWTHQTVMGRMLPLIDIRLDQG